MNKNTICFVAGKSGGHIVPCLTLMQHYRTDNDTLSVLFFSANTPLDRTIISASCGITHHVQLSLSSIKRTNFASYLTIAQNSIYSLVISFFYLIKNRPSRIITTGGVVALPVCIAGFILRIPITLYSLDAVPGKAIQFLAPLAHSIVVAFANTRKNFPVHKTTHAAYPLRYTTHNSLVPREVALKNLHLPTTRKTIVILGGSQGSAFLNDMIKQWVEKYPHHAQHYTIIHQTGSHDVTDWSTLYTNKNIASHVFGYAHDLTNIYRAADVIVCRAGAGTLFEIEFFKKQCIVIPLRASTTTHQVDNAREITHDYPHLFTWIEQKDVENNPELLFSLLHNVCNHTTTHINTDIAPLTPG